MEVYGNKTWNNATDNREKTLVPMAEETFKKIQEQLENSGINYFAYSKDSKTVMAINDKDLDWFKSIVGRDADRMETRKSEVAYTPPQKNIIGNAEYRYIPNKEYISLDSDSGLKMAELMEKQNIQFSGRISANGKATLTVSHADLKAVKNIQNSVISMRKQFASEEKADEIIGNKAYRDIHNKHYFHSKLTPEEYKEIQPVLDNETQYSGLIRDGKIIFTMEKDEAPNFLMVLQAAQNEIDIKKNLSENGLDSNRISEMSDIIHSFAREDMHMNLETFFDGRYSDEQFSEMKSLAEKYISQTPIERIQKESAISDMLKLKNDIDVGFEIEEYFSQHSYSDAQKEQISDMFRNNSSRIFIDALDETFSVSDIQKYNYLLNNTVNGNDVRDFLNNHRMMASLPFEDRYADEIEELTAFLIANERIQETASHTDYDEYLNAFEEEFVNHVLMSDNENFKNSFFDKFSEFKADFTNRIFGELKDRIFEETEKVPEKIELTETEKNFLDAEIEPVMAKSVLAWDEIEDLGYIFFEEGYIDRYSPSDRAMYGNGVDEKDIYALADKMRNGGDIRADLTRALLSNQQTFTTKRDNTFNVTYNKDDITATFGNAEKSISYEAVGDAFLNLFEGEYKEIMAAREAERQVEEKAEIQEETTVKEDSLTFSWGKDREWFTENDILHDFAEKNPEISFALANAVFEYLDEKQNTERAIPDLNAGWYKKTDFVLSGVLNGEDFNYEGRFDIGDGKGTGGGSIIEHISQFQTAIINSDRYPFDNNDRKADAQEAIDTFIPFLESHLQLTAEEMQILSDLKAEYPIRTESEIEKAHGTFRIMQLNHSDDDNDKYYGIRFFSKEFNDSHGVQLNHEDYTQVFEGNLSDYPADRTLESIYERMNMGVKPDGYTGHSLSMSDVIITNIDGEEKAYYCDDFGFTEMSEFFREKELEKSDIVQEFRAKTEEMFQPVPTNYDDFNPSVDAIERSAKNYIDFVLRENDLQDEITIKDVIISGSRCRGLETENSDLDIVIEYESDSYREDAFFNLLNDAEVNDNLHLGVSVDYNPIRKEETGILEKYLPTVESYLAEKAGNMKNVGTLTEEKQRTADDITIGDKYLMKDFFGEKEVTVTSMNGVYPDDVGISEKHKSGNMEYETTSNIDKFKLHNTGIYLGNVNEMQENDLETAKNHINEFCQAEYGTNADFSNLSKVDIAYTTDEDNGLEIQVSADLEQYRMIFAYDGNIVREEQYESLADMSENVLSVLDYGDLTSLSEDEKAPVIAESVGVEDDFSDIDTQQIRENIENSDSGFVKQVQTDVESLDKDAPLFADSSVYEEIAKAEKADTSTFENTYGEQMSLFGFDDMPFEKPKRQRESKPVELKQAEINGINTLDELKKEIKRGSGFQNGKFRIQKFYEDKKPSTKEFADFLKHEYGIGGHSADDPIAFVDHDAKGIQFTLNDENAKMSDTKFTFNWTEAAKMASDLINKGEYLSEKQAEQYIEWKNPVKEEEIAVEEAITEVEEFVGDIQEDAVDEPETVKADEPVSTEKADNFVITDDALGEGGAKTKFKNNIAAIEMLRTLESENRSATKEEMETLSKYVGWGAIPQAFDKNNDAWSNEYSQLKDLLTPQEYRQANASVLDAFYTSPVVIDGIYEALEKFGFEGGNILEPAMGVGNFFGKMPEEMRSESKLYGVELDSISGRIAQKLYPDADIAVQGFEKNNFQNGCFDVAVGNVPFGELPFKDNKHDTTKLHDYFFAESLDKVKNGGIVAFVTSAGTLDKRDENTRKMLADKADFIGAIRLPGGKNGAFKDNAGTEVTTDIIFLQKHEGKSVAEMSDIPDWVHIGETADGLPINKYFEQNPDMVLGTVVEGNKLYGSGTMVVADDDFDLKSALSEAVSKLSATISNEKTRDVYAKSVEGLEVKIPSNLRNYSFFEQDNNIFFKKNDVSCFKVYDKDSTQFERAKAFIELRDTTRDLLEAQELDKPDSVIKDLQTKLNTVYDDFYAKYGLIHSQSNKRYFSDDVSFNLVAGLEKKFDKNKLEEKSDIFTKRTIQPPKAVEHVETAIEALTLSVAETASVDFDYMSKLTGMTEAEIKKDLVGEIYKVPHTENTYQTASEYLSGDIRQKLKTAEEVAEYDSDFNINVNALKAAMPEPLKAGDIDVKIGATWIDKKFYDQFMYETFQTPRNNRNDTNHFSWQKHKVIEAEYSEHAGSWHIDNKNQDRSVISTQQYGSRHMNSYEIMEHLLNLKDPKIYKTIEVPDGMGDTKEKRVVDIDATRVVQKKADKIKAEFKKWIFKDSERREEIVNKYNEIFNSVKPREYDGSNLTFPMMNSEIKLHDHQKNAIAHAMFGGNTLFAHCVGAGKTFEMIATAMESKRLGLCTKSMFAVPNHLTEQIGDDFQKLYPSANILVATKKDFQKENRQQLFAKIATGNFDAVIIGHSQLGMIPISKERQENMIQSQINDIISGIEELKKSEGSKFQIKAMERTKKSLEKNLDKLQKNHDDTVTFEQLGIDKLFVDEAHEFKNLFTPTKMTNISGISNSASQKALDLFMKCQYLDEKTGGKGVCFATGTPLSNSVTELHTMMRYLEYDFLKDHGLQHFDNWVTVFGEQKTDWELAPAGNKFKERTRIANYNGMPELMSMFKQIADIRTADTLKLDVPDCDYKVVNVEATDFQKQLVEELADRADAINAGNVDPSIDNMLKITSDGRKLGLDPRLIDPSFEDNAETKLNKCVENVARIHHDTAEDKLTQIIFCDLGVPHKSNAKTAEPDKDGDDDSKSSAERDSLEEECDFCVYDDIRSKLIERGIPASEIAYIHDAKTEKQKSELFDKVRSGEVRVLLGSTAKMGTGTNVQKKLIAVHDLDIPWRPADLERAPVKATI